MSITLLLNTRPLLKTLLIFALLYVALALLFYLFQSKFIFFPSTTPRDFVYSFPYPHEEIFIEAHDGEKIHALLFAKEISKGTILYFHGNAGSLTGWGWIAEDFDRYHYDLLIMDYRTYGKSKGKLTEKNLYADALSCYEYIKSRSESHAIVIYGRSIGTGVAVDLATKTTPDMLVLEAPFTNLPDLARHHFPVLPYRLLSRFRFESDSKAQQVNCQVHIIHGTKDNIIPYRFGRELYTLFPAGQATFYSVEGGGHNDLSGHVRYHDAMAGIFSAPEME